MVDARLVAYVAGLLKKGYTTQVIRDQLLSHGYDDTTITEAIHTAQGKPHLNPLLLLTIAGAILLVTGIIVGILALTSGPDANIVLSITPSAQTVLTAETLTFTLRMTNTIDDPSTVQLNHDILANNELVQRETDALTVRGEHTQTVRIPLSNTVTPGPHTLRTTITFDKTQKTQQFDFLVEQGTAPPVTIDLALCTPSCDDFNACTTDTCTDGRCTYTPKASCCGDGICEGGENVLSCNQDCQDRTRTESTETIKGQALDLLTRDKQQAAQECARIALDYEHDNCFTTLSELSSDSLFCTPIHNIERKDACYLQFALAGDPSICTNIIDSALQQTCFQYGRFAALSNTA